MVKDRLKTQYFTQNIGINVNANDFTCNWAEILNNALTYKCMKVDKFLRPNDIVDGYMNQKKIKLLEIDNITYQHTADNKLIIGLNVICKHWSKVTGFNWNIFLNNICNDADIDLTDVIFL